MKPIVLAQDSSQKIPKNNSKHLHSVNYIPGTGLDRQYI